jgi:predicted nucleotidyltransferase
MNSLDAETEKAVRAFLARLPSGIRVERALLYGSRARGDYRADSDADLALIMEDRGNDWQLLWDLSGIAYDVFLQTGVLIQPVPIASSDWAHPEDFSRPSFLRNIAREGIPL